MPVKVTPPANGNNGSVDTDPINAHGRDTNIVFQFADGVTGWSFVSFSIKTTSPNQPPAGMFRIVGNPGNTMTVLDHNGDGKLYKYNLTVSDGTNNHVIDPDIQNENIAM